MITLIVILLILTIANSAFIINFIYKSKKRGELVMPTVPKEIGNKDITKIYPDIQPITVVDSKDISNFDIKNILLSLKDKDKWKMGYSNIEKDYQFISVEYKNVRLFCQFQNGKILSLSLKEPMDMDIVKSNFSNSRTKEEKTIIDNFTVLLWPFYKEACDRHNEKHEALKLKFSQDIKDIVPQIELRDSKISDLLN